MGKNEKHECKCNACGKSVILRRDSKGRWIATTSGVTVGGILGGMVGAAAGIASGGWAIPATIPMGIAGGALLGGGGYLIGDKLVDKFKCPNCDATIDIL